MHRTASAEQEGEIANLQHVADFLSDPTQSVTRIARINSRAGSGQQ